MSTDTRNDDDSMITGINVTPLVDVALVLLVVLMVTATYLAARTIPMALPTAETGEAVTATLAVSIEPSGATWLDGRRVDRSELRNRIAESRRRSTTRAFIAADGRTAHRFVVGVIDLLRQQGITQIAINVRPGELSAK
jgi:biopolymer transport protein ExbD